MKATYLSRTQAADFIRSSGLEISERSLRRWSIEQRLIPYVVIRRRQYFVVDELAKWIANLTKDSSVARNTQTMENSIGRA